MNETWIKDGHEEANLRRKYVSKNKEHLRFDRTDYLDIMGLFETCWIMFDHSGYNKDRNGYPTAKKT